MPDSVNTGFQRIRTETVHSGGSQQSRGRALHFDPPLLRGQLLEVIVAKTLTDGVWLEARNMMFKANLPTSGLREGERLLLKVLDPNSSPLKLKLISDAELPLSSLAGVSTYLRSLLFRQHQLMPTQQLLTNLLSGVMSINSVSPELRVLIEALKAWQKSPERIDGLWVKEKLKQSGLFMEGNNKLAVETKFLDIKTLLLRWIAQDETSDKSAARAAIDGITSSQVKALDGLMQNNIQYSFLLPFFGDNLIEARISREQELEQRDHWHVYLRHQSEEMGDFCAEIFMQKQRVSILFKSDQSWIVDLINENHAELESAISALGLSLSQILATPFKPPKVLPYVQHDHQTIFDMKV